MGGQGQLSHTALTSELEGRWPTDGNLDTMARALSQPGANRAHSRCSMKVPMDFYHRCDCWTTQMEQNADRGLTGEVRPSPKDLESGLALP